MLLRRCVAVAARLALALLLLRAETVAAVLPGVRDAQEALCRAEALAQPEAAAEGLGEALPPPLLLLLLPLPLGQALALPPGLPLPSRLLLPLGDLLAAPSPLALLPPLLLPLLLALAVLHLLPAVLAVGVALAVALRVPALLLLTVPRALRVLLRAALCVPLPVELWLALLLAQPLPELEGEKEEEGLAEGDPVSEPLPVPEAEGLGVRVPLCVAAGLRLGSTATPSRSLTPSPRRPEYPAARRKRRTTMSKEPRDDIV